MSQGGAAMRIHLTLFCLISGGALAGATTPTAVLVQDKPDRLYVLSDTLLTDSYSDNLTSDNQGGVSEGQLWHHDDYQWQDGLGGSGSRQDAQESDDWDSDGYLWGSTNRTSSVMYWDTNGSGTEIYTANNGSTTTYAISLPLLTSEHCVVNDPQRPPPTVQSLGDDNWVTNQVSEEYVRYSQTRWRLQTGGRGGQSSLFRLSATAALILDKRAERPFYNVNSQAIPPGKITVIGRALYADTNLWVVLPNGTNLDATPFVAGADFYQMTVTEQKHIPSIDVNDLSLDTSTPEFCAGQHLDFKLIFDPPPECASQVSIWDLSGPPVNESWRESPSGSVNYRYNPELCTNLMTSCWYPGGGGQTASVGTAFQFANGQYCSLGVQGNFNIAKPAFSGFDNCSSLVGLGWNSPVLQANMQWSATVQSVYDGNLGVTQLINGTNVCCNTGGQFRLDGTNELCNATPTNLLGQTYTATNPATHTVRFVYTRNLTANPTAGLTATFKDYLRFRPAGNISNIWVTLSTNTWSMDGFASLSGGLIRSNLPPANALAGTDDFPSWTDSFAP
jgi:hypothetical protein